MLIQNLSSSDANMDNPSFHDRLLLPLTTLFSEVLDKGLVVSISSVNHTIAVVVLQNSSNHCCIYTSFRRKARNASLLISTWRL
jgi:hypothetical protein